MEKKKAGNQEGGVSREISGNQEGENKHFYSKDGKLYERETNDLISEFAYVAK